MLDRDPNPSRPPDGGGGASSRPRARPHKAKNAPKKQPQRGLGVAQLEKLRLEEQSKQEAACLASLHHRVHHVSQQVSHQVPQQQQQQHHPLPSPPCLPRQIHLLEPSSASSSSSSPSSSSPSSFPHLLREPPSFKLGACGSAAHASYLPFPGMAGLLARRHGLPLLAPEDTEPCLSSLSHVHDLSSPGSTVSSKQSLLSGSPWHGSHGVVCFGTLPQASDAAVRTKNQTRDEDWDDPCFKTKDPMTSLFPSPCISEEKQTEGPIQAYSAQNKAHAIPITDLCLLHRSNKAFDVPRSSLGLPMVSIASTGNQARELSSFQMFSLSPTWSSGDQVLNRKRPWQLTQEPSRNSEPLKGVDLNNSADEVEIDATDKSSLENNDITSSTMGDFRGACSSLPISKVSHSRSLAGKVHVSSSTTFEIETPFLTLRSQDCDAYHVSEAVTCGEFLTLGPSGLSSLKQGNGNMGTAVDNSCTEPLNLYNVRNITTACIPGQGLTEKAKDFIKLLPLVSRMGNNDTEMTSQEDIESEPFFMPMPIDMELPSCSPWHKVKNHYGSQHSNAVNGSLDLELRLSL